MAWESPTPGDGRASFRRLVAIASLVPLGFGLLLLLVAPASLGPVFDSRAGIRGLPPVVGFLGILAALALVNLLVVRFVRSTTVVGVVVAVTTTIGLFVVLLAPAIVLIALNA